MENYAHALNGTGKQKACFQTSGLIGTDVGVTNFHRSYSNVGWLMTRCAVCEPEHSH